MKLLIYEWASYLQYDVDWVCKEKGIQADKFSWKFVNKNQDEAFETWFSEQIDCRQFDALFSVNYWPLLSKVAQKQGIRYVAWCYDNPLNVINIEETLGNPVNTVIFFDRVQAQKYLDAGFDTVHYLPLCVNVNRLSKLMLSETDYKKYGSDVALVGSLYESRMSELKALMDDYTKGYLDAVLAAQQNLYGCYLFDEVVTDELTQKINDSIKKQHPETNFHLRREALTFAMASEVTRRDRLVLLTLLGRRFDTRLYSFQTSEILQGVKCFPPIDYVAEMPKVFTATKINLNPVLRCIQSGIPLRALDVMGAGGFLLSSYQPELAEYFVQEDEMVMYESMEDAVEKAEFFLKHEDVRKQIAENGRQKVFEAFSLSERWDQIMELAGLIGSQAKSVPVQGDVTAKEPVNAPESKYQYYVVAPAEIASGGPELTHQLCHELNALNVPAKMYYIAGGNLEPVDTDALPRYTKYNTVHALDYDEANNESSVVVINESATSYIPYFPKAKKALWWMSVDNYLIDPYKISEDEMKQHVDFHLVQSQYAYNYVKNTLKVSESRIITLSDYTHESFSERYFPDDMRQNLVLYNPKKGYENLAPLIEMTPEVKWVPLINLNEDQLKKIMQLAKIYIDLGNHPGKDRIPRETAVSGCCIITNKQGSAAFYEDVPIPEEYKFEDFSNRYDEMKQLILDICNHFELHSRKFDDYRKWIKEERMRFTQDSALMVEVINGFF